MGTRSRSRSWFFASDPHRPHTGGIRAARGSCTDSRHGNDYHRKSGRARFARPACHGRAGMRAIIFTGPTLSAAQVPGELDAVCWPPAAQADVYRAALERPAAIGIIDGYFENVPSIWHKEILWAMSQGIH